MTVNGITKIFFTNIQSHEYNRRVLHNFTKVLSRNINFGTENKVEWECAVRTSSSIDDMCMWAGLKLTDTPDYTVDDNQAYFLYATNDTKGTLSTNTNLYFVYSISGNDYITNLGISLAASTLYRFKIVIDEQRKIKVFVNGVQYGLVTSSGENTVSTSSQLSSALTNDIDFLPFVGVEALAASSKSMSVGYEKISRDIFE